MSSPKVLIIIRPRMASWLLFLSVLLVYVANGRTLGSGDTLPGRYLPFSMLREGNTDLDEFPFLYDEAARRTFPMLDGVPYFLHYRGGHYRSAYSPAPAVVAVPIYAWPVLAGVPVDPWAPRLEKLAAALMVASSVLCLFWALTDVAGTRWALGIAMIYAFGTSSWSVSSQALWQHGPSQLFLALLLLCLARGRHDERWLSYGALAASAAAVMRSTDALVALPVFAWILYTRPRLALRVVAFALPPVAALVLYNVWCFGSLAGSGGSTTAPAWAFFSRTPSLEGLLGVLASPGRGLFVYSPVLVFSVAGLLLGLRRAPSLLGPLALGVLMVIVVVGQWFRWWGGHTWGPRLLADVTPILCFFLYPVTPVLERHRVLKAVFVLLAVLSVAAHGLGAFFYDWRWDALVDVDRRDSALWSWKASPLVFYGREVASAAGRSLRTGARGEPTSADSPARLAAAYESAPVASEAFVGETLEVPFRARNTGAAVWLVSAPGDRGTVRLGWRWSQNGVALEEGRTPLEVDVRPGRVARFVARVAVPPAPGDYTLTFDLVSESVTWFADQGQRPVTAAVTVRPLEIDGMLSTPLRADARSAAATISTDRASYGRGDTIRLAVELRNPGRPGQFDAYLLGQGPERRVWFFDGRQLSRPTGEAWIPWARRLPFPARASGRFEMAAARLEPGAYRWHVVMTESDTVRPMARGTTVFTVGP
jgi:hypothetical protein